MKKRTDEDTVSSIVALSTSGGNKKAWRIFDSLASSSPHLILFTSTVLLLMYGYEIFNFSLSIDEELVNDSTWWKMYIEQGGWANAPLTRVMPSIGNIPMLATVIFCVGVGGSACIIARLIFTRWVHQFAFVAIYVTVPFWPNIAEFNISSHGTGFGLLVTTLALLLFYSEIRFKSLLTMLVLTIACGFAQTFGVLFLIGVCLRQLSPLVEISSGTRRRFAWFSASLVYAGALLTYLLVEIILLKTFSLHLVHVQRSFGLSSYLHSPLSTTSAVILYIWGLVNGQHPSFLGYGVIVLALPWLGVLVLSLRILFVASISRSQQVEALAIFSAALLLGLSPIIVSAAVAPTRIFYTFAPILAFLTAQTFTGWRKLERALWITVGVTMFVSIWISVSLFYTDHLARQRDQVLASRIMARVDQIAPDPQSRIPFVLVAATPPTTSGPFRKFEVFGDSFFDTNHYRNGNPHRVALYLQTLGIDTLEPHLFSEVNAYRSTIEAMPVWPATGSIAMVKGMLVIKLGSELPP